MWEWKPRRDKVELFIYKMRLVSRPASAPSRTNLISVSGFMQTPEFHPRGVKWRCNAAIWNSLHLDCRGRSNEHSQWCDQTKAKVKFGQRMESYYYSFVDLLFLFWTPNTTLRNRQVVTAAKAASAKYSALSRTVLSPATCEVCAYKTVESIPARWWSQNYTMHGINNSVCSALTEDYIVSLTSSNLGINISLN